MKSVQICEIVKFDEIASGIFDVTIKSKEIAHGAKCGQFLHIDCGDGINTLLRRPISICDTGDDWVRFIFEKKGSGTDALSHKKVGDSLNIIGPVGNSFTISDKFKKPMIIGGGIGVYPLLKLAKALGNADVLLGFRTKDRVTLEDEFKEIAQSCIVATDDGSYGYNGYAVELLEKAVKNGECDIIYSCGPMPMLRAVKRIAEGNSVKCQLSLEQRMGCGIGACLVCTCETTSPGTHKHKRVCKNGPVFWSEEVTLNG